jgi:ParB family chromosome partitioning protein
MERAWAIRGLCDRFGLSHAQVGEKLGIDRTSAANLARLTELEQDVRDLLESGQLTAGHGKVLLGAPAGAVRVGLARQAATQGWSVRRLEQAAARASQAPAGAAPAVFMGELALAKATALKELEKQLGEHLGTSVRIRANAGGKRGSVVVKFYDLDHFDGLMSKMGFSLK